MRLLCGSLLIVLATASLFACNNDDDSASSSTENGSGDPSSGGANAGTCLDPAKFDYVLQPRKATSGSSFLLYQATPSAANQIFGSTIDEVFRIDVDAKTATSVYAPEGAIAPRHYQHGSDIVVTSGSKIWTVPKAGGNATEKPKWTRTPQGSLAGTQEAYLDGETFYALDNGLGGVVFKHDLESGTETDLGAEPRSNASSIRLGEDAIYSYYPKSEANHAPTVVWKLPKAGGTTKELAFTGAPSEENYPFGVVGNDIYLLSVTSATFEAHILRASREGGAVTDLGKFMYVLSFKGQTNIVSTANGVFLRLQDDMFWIPNAASSFQKIACLATGSGYAFYATTILDNKVYASVVNTDAKTGGVVVLPLP
ncbi:hypothetical protein AKJ09_06706 [Labilithrix luteola]|uniref:Lipoprotein n=1 Tax=Labilithrix luteola TaxID=1391654 RepID=A0A0K1Q2T6_9BACT|nr:hypothetical protein [Labilithrix luteola]AKV00043.1 hypothetical protein AKJ09_06706 [Labilithrix luteola]